MEYYAFAAVCILLFLFFVLTGKIEEKKARQSFRKRLKEQYGAYSNKKYADGRMESLVSALRPGADANGRTAFLVDDITWNDLEMDRLFQAMDYTRCAAGEEALYRWLRTPLFDKAILHCRERHFRFFAAHEQDRLDYLMFMADVGRTGKYSVYDYLGYLDDLEEKNCFLTKLTDILIVVCLILGIAVNGYFFVPFAALLAYHGATYMKQKKEIEPYLTTFAYFVRILDSVKHFAKMSPAFREEFCEEIAGIEKDRAEFGAFRRGAFVALDDDANATVMDLAKVILVYLKMIFHIDLIKLYAMLHTVKEKKETLIHLLCAMGEIEACVSVAYARAAFDEMTVPEFEAWEKGGDVLLEAEGLFHPLIENPVKNSLCQHRGMLLTGSNASGKSTFLKAVAINVLLAQTIHTVCASSYRANFFQIYSSMALRDSLQQGESYFIVEIKSIKRIFDAVDNSDYPVLCTIDEVLRGTNTAERIGASTELLKALSKKGALCFAATHDLELTGLLEEEMDNYHFEEMVQGKEISFPYYLTKGAAKGRNAIRLLAAFGFEPKLVEKAEQLAGGFQ